MNRHKVTAKNIKTGKALEFETVKDCAAYFETTRQYIAHSIKKADAVFKMVGF